MCFCKKIIIHIETKQPLFTEAAKDAGRGGGGGGREEEEPRTEGAVLAGGLMEFVFTHFTFTPFPKNSSMDNRNPSARTPLYSI